MDVYLFSTIAIIHILIICIADIIQGLCGFEIKRNTHYSKSDIVRGFIWLIIYGYCLIK